MILVMGTIMSVNRGKIKIYTWVPIYTYITYAFCAFLLLICTYILFNLYVYNIIGRYII